mgnify:CR=1 FL=1|tara:strand:+ start:17 stop:1462 length:1446 start_codon:yes stop_codon:yes gene_type:complete
MVGGRSRYNVRVRNIANRGTSRSHMRKPQRTSHVYVRRPRRSRVGLWKAADDLKPCTICRGSKVSPSGGGECGACDGTGLEGIARRASLDDRIAQARKDTHDKATQHRRDAKDEGDLPDIENMTEDEWREWQLTQPYDWHRYQTEGAGQYPIADKMGLEGPEPGLMSRNLEPAGWSPEPAQRDMDAWLQAQKRADSPTAGASGSPYFTTGEPMDIALRLLKEALDTPKSGFTDTDDYPHRRRRGLADGRGRSKDMAWLNLTGIAQPTERMRQFYEALHPGTIQGWKHGHQRDADTGEPLPHEFETPRPMWPMKEPELTQAKKPKSKGKTSPKSYRQVATEAGAPILEQLNQQLETQGMGKRVSLPPEILSAIVSGKGYVSRSPVHRSADDDYIYQTARETPDTHNPYSTRLMRPGVFDSKQTRAGRVDVREPTKEEEEQWGMFNQYEPIHGVLTDEDIDTTGSPDWWKDPDHPSVMSGDEI